MSHGFGEEPSVAPPLLVLVLGPGGRRRRLRFDGYAAITVGSGPSCDVDLPAEPATEGLRAVLRRREDGALSITARGEGVRAGGAALATGATAELAPGSSVEIGAVELVLQPPATGPTADAILGRFRPLRPCASGGMAELSLVEDLLGGGRAVLKRLRRELVDDLELRAQFASEQRITSALDHHNVCRALACGEDEQGPFIVLEHVDGSDLAALVARREPVALPLAAHLVGGICGALDHAHQLRDADGEPLAIVHRHVAPKNVMLSRAGVVKLIDFGVARWRLSRDTSPGIIKGEPQYMSPEQVCGQRLDRRSDLFAVGSLLYELVTGAPAFSGDSVFATLENVRNVQLVWPRDRNPLLPEAVERVIFSCLQRDPVDRVGSAHELRDALDEAVPAARQTRTKAHAGLFFSLISG